MSESTFEILQLSLPTPFPVGDVNAYLLGTEGSVLVDTGLYWQPSIETLASQIEASGRRIEDIRTVLITHDHLDHAGAALHLSERCQAAIYCHPRSSLEVRYDAELIERLSRFLVQCGLPRGQVEAGFRAFQRNEALVSRDATPHEIRRIQGGATLHLDGLTLEVLETPGHSPDHLCYLDVDGGLLFSGDTLLPHITPNPLLSLDPLDGYRRDRNLLRYLDSIQALKGCGAACAYPGHGRVIDDVAGLIDRNLAFIEQRRERFFAHILAGARRPGELAAAVFGTLDIANTYLAISETVGYLDLLERDGQVTVDWDSPNITARPG
ncbi:MAG: MBL fold metallo-hydrolase [Bradymonadales bacterium]|nr:MBL fold metallo-hydrolase [Bradymonadales bacterium]